MANNSHKYYLALDKNIVDFSGIPELPNMTSFLTLSLFVGLFDSAQELILGLKSLGLVNSELQDFNISIVKSIKKDMMECHYVPVTDKLLYKSGISFFSKKSMWSFFFKNRDKYEILESFFRDYLDEIKGLLRYFKRECDEIKYFMELANGQGRKQLEEALEKKTNSLRNFVHYSNNIKRLLQTTHLLLEGSGIYDRELEFEYINLLECFIDDEIYYIRNQKCIPNYRGLMKMTVKVVEYLRDYPELELPCRDEAFLKLKLKLLKAYKKAKCQVNRNISEVAREDEGDDTLEDPDSYIFLEEEDYLRMARGQSDSFLQSMEVSIENLAEKKESHGKL